MQLINEKDWKPCTFTEGSLVFLRGGRDCSRLLVGCGVLIQSLPLGRGCRPHTQGISRETVQALTTREKSRTVLNGDVTQGC